MLIVSIIGCTLFALMDTYWSTVVRASVAGLLLNRGMLLPSEQSKQGLSEIKCHRSQRLRAVESSQNTS